MHRSYVRVLRISLVALICVVTLLVAFNYFQRVRARARLAQRAPQILSPEMVRAGEMIEYSDYANGLLRFKIKAERLLETRKGKSMLEGIEAVDFNPDGSVGGRISSRKAEYDRDQKQAFFSGDVRIDLGQGMKLATDSLHYDLNENVGFTEDPFEFYSSQGRGRARGFRYEHTRKDLYLNRDVDFVITRVTEKPGGFVESEDFNVESEKGYISRSSQIFRFEGKARLESKTSVLSGDKIEAAFTPDMKRMKSLLCDGNASYESKSPGERRSLSGERILFGIGPGSGALESVDVQGRAVFALETETMTEELKAGQLILRLDPAGLPQAIESTGGVEFHQARGAEDTLISGGTLNAALRDNVLRDLHVRESARMLTKRSGGQGQDELMAGDIRLGFRDLAEKSALHSLRAEKAVQWNSLGRKRGSAGEERRLLKAGLLNLSYADDGNSLEAGDASGDVEIAGISTGSAGDVRRMLTDTVRFRFYPDNRMRDFEGEGNVRVFFTNPSSRASSGAGEAQTASSGIGATFRESDGQVDRFSQWGNFSYRDGTNTVTSDRSDYDSRSGILVLSGHPLLVDENGRHSGEMIEYDRTSEVVTVRQKVRSILVPKKGAGSTPFTSSSQSGGPAVVTADMLNFWTERSTARYSGNVQLLAETMQVQAATLEIIGNGETIQAERDVRHLILRRTGSAAGKGGRQGETSDPILVKSGSLKYVQAENAVHYSGSVRLQSADVDMQCESMDVFLDKSGKEIERAAARGDLRMRQGNRTVRGEAGDYFLNPGKFVVTGNLAEIEDSSRRGKSRARRLTFFTTDDRILLDNR